MLKEPIYVVDGTRTPFLKARGKPGPWSASDLAVSAGKALLNRVPAAQNTIEEVILGCAAPGVDEVNIGRYVALRLGLGDKVPGYTVMRNCASGMQAIDSAINQMLAGRANVVLAGGVDALSRTPLMYSDKMVLWFAKFSTAKTMGQKAGLFAQLPVGEVFTPVIALMRGLTDPMVGLIMGQTAENLAFRFGITRAEMDVFSAESHKRVIAAQKAGAFANEISPLYDATGKLYAADDGMREDSTAENLAKLKPFFDKKYGNVTAANSSQVTDGASWLLLATEAGVKQHGFPVLGKIVDTHWAGLDPSIMGLGPVYASTPLLTRNGWTLDSLDTIEINEAFAAQVIACQRAWQDAAFCKKEFDLPGAFGTLDPQKLNVDGGAIAMGHPVGASGARIALHALNVLKRTGGKRALATICIGGGQGGAMLLEAA
jgi:acetyl-CoA C-acetyltransferase